MNTETCPPASLQLLLRSNSGASHACLFSVALTASSQVESVLASPPTSTSTSCGRSPTMLILVWDSRWTSPLALTLKRKALEWLIAISLLTSFHVHFNNIWRIRHLVNMDLHGLAKPTPFLRIAVRYYLLDDSSCMSVAICLGQVPCWWISSLEGKPIIEHMGLVYMTRPEWKLSTIFVILRCYLLERPR